MNQDVSQQHNSKAAKSRIRVAKACDRCKRKKTKCDGVNPCHACVKHKLTCIYTPSVFAKTGSTGGTDGEDVDVTISATTLTAAVNAANNAKTIAEQKKAILEIKKPVIMAKLRDRITVLENDLARLANLMRAGGENAKRSSDDMISDSDKNGRNTSIEEDENAKLLLGKPTQGIKEELSLLKRKRCEDNQTISNPYNDDVLTYMEAFPDGAQGIRTKMRYTRRFARTLPFRFGHVLMKDLSEESKKQVKIPRIQYYGWNMSGGHYLSPRKIKPYPDLLPASVAQSLIEYFFDKINPLHAVLHRPMFMKQFEVFQKDPTKKECRLFSAILHVVCAIAMRFTEVSENRTFEFGLEEQLFDDGHSTLQAFAFEWESVEIIQGFLLMTMYLRTCHRQPSAWACLGTALRMCAGMGLMHKAPIELCVSEYDVLKRRRVFWACFVMDRTLCMECGRHFSIREDEMSVPIPYKYVEDGWQTPISHALITLCIALGDLVYDKDLNLNSEELDSIKTRLLNWNDTVKVQGFANDLDLDQFRDLSPGLVGQFRLTYYNSLFFIHMRAVYGLIGIQWDSTFVDRQLYVECVIGVTTVASSLQRLGALKSPWWLTLSTIYHAGCVALLLIYNQTAVELMSTELRKIISIIQDIADDGRFIMARECLWSLKTLNHMMHMKLSQTMVKLRDIGMDHGPATINKGNFTAMGVLDSNGNEVLSIENMQNDMLPMNNDQDQDQQQQQQQQQEPQSMEQPEKFPLLFQAPPPMESTPKPAPSKNDPIMSLEWFDNWDWQMGSSMADYFATPMGGAAESGEANDSGIVGGIPHQQSVEGPGRPDDPSVGGYMDIQLQL